MPLSTGYFGAGGGAAGWQHEGAAQQPTGSQQARRQQCLGRQQTGLQQAGAQAGAQAGILTGLQQLTGSQHVFAQGLQQVVTQGLPQGSQQHRCRHPADAESTANSHTAVSTTRDMTHRRIALPPHLVKEDSNESTRCGPSRIRAIRLPPTDRSLLLVLVTKGENIGRRGESAKK